MSEPKKTEDYALAEDQLITGGLIGVGVVVIVTLLGFNQLDRPLTLALYCFAGSVPLLSMVLLSAVTTTRFPLHNFFWYHTLASAVGALAALIGVNSLFWHFSRKAGSLFLFMSIIGFIGYMHYFVSLKRFNLDK